MLMFSAPPASTVAASPTISALAACTTASMPDAHARLTVSAGVPTGAPASRPT